MLEIVEKFAAGKSKNDDYSEDRLVISDHHFGVIDGSTGPGYTDKSVITRILDRAVDLAQNMPADQKLDVLVDQFVQITKEEKDNVGLKDYRSTGGFVFCIYSDYYNEIWRVGDCKFKCGDKSNDVFWCLEETCAQMRALVLKSMKLNGISDEVIMAHPDYNKFMVQHLPYLARFLCREGLDTSFGAILGLPVPKKYIERYPNIKGDIAICSDGYPLLCDTLESSETELARLLKVDPLCIADNLQCKGLGPDRVSFDDRAFIRGKSLIES